MKRRKIFVPFWLTLIGVFFFLNSCTKEKVRPGFVVGQVLFEVYGDVTFQNTYSLLDSLNLHIMNVANFKYLIKTSLDSVDTIKSILNQKPYLKNKGRTFGLLYLNDTLQISTTFFEMDFTRALDWFMTVSNLNLMETPTWNSSKFGVLSVPEGQEQYWVDELKECSIIKSAELNHIFYIDP